MPVIAKGGNMSSIFYLLMHGYFMSQTVWWKNESSIRYICTLDKQLLVSSIWLHAFEHLNTLQN